jgi:uncharacterized membrane protein YdfJ with MMPL/SSD domain
VVIAWLLAIVALNGLSSSLSSVTNDTAAAYLPSSAPSTKVALLETAQQGQLETNAAVVVLARESGLTRPSSGGPNGSWPETATAPRRSAQQPPDPRC